MRFRLTPRSMTLDDLELYKFEFSENFSLFRRFRTQQQLNEWRWTSIVCDNVIFGMVSRRAGLSSTAGLSCLLLTLRSMAHQLWLPAAPYSAVCKSATRSDMSSIAVMPFVIF